MDKNKSLNPISIRPEILLDIDKMNLKELTEEDLIEMGKSVTEVHTYAQWILGRLVDEVAQRRGDIDTYAKAIGQRRDKLYQCVYVYRKFVTDNPKFNPDNYHGSVPWGMLQYVASKSDQPIKLLNELVDNGILTQDSAVRAVKGKETGVQIPIRPRVTWKWNEQKQKWTIKFNLEEMALIDWEEAKEDVLKMMKGQIS